MISRLDNFVFTLHITLFLDMYKYANERLFDLNFLLKVLSKNPKRGKLMRRGDEAKIVYVSSIMRFSD